MEDNFTPLDLVAVTDDFAMLRFFTGEIRPSVIALLARMVPHKEALFWLRDVLINHIGYWPGPAEVRGLLCTRFEPADGVDQWCSLPGYTAQDGETRSLTKHEQLKAQEQVGGYIAEESRVLIRRLAVEMRQLPEANT